MDIATEIPADYDQLSTLIAATPIGQRFDLGQRFVAQQVDKEDAAVYFEHVETDVRHGENIELGRRVLSDALSTASQALSAVVRAMDDLTGPLYDIEYVEGLAAGDMRSYLADAARAVRVASALNPYPLLPGHPNERTEQ